MEAQVLWDQALAYISAKVPRQVFETWFVPARLEAIDDTIARIEVPNKFFGEWLAQHYGPLLAEALAEARGGPRVPVTFVTGGRGSVQGR